MKYRIKKPEVEKAVCGLFETQEDFKKYFSACCINQMYCGFDYIKLIVHKNQSVTGFPVALLIKKSDIEEVVEYDPRKWNPYPKVTPPKKGWYRVELDYQDEVIHRAMYWNGENWLNQEMVFKRQAGWIEIEKDNPRFKPWDDEEGEE